MDAISKIANVTDCERLDDRLLRKAPDCRLISHTTPVMP